MGPRLPKAIPLRCSTTQTQRCFSSTPAPQISKARQQMLTWIKGPGEVFRRPRKGTTAYLGAFDRKGKMLRSGETVADRSAKSRELKAQRKREEEDPTGSISADQSPPDQGKPEPEFPPEAQEDLMPFPLNPFFRSETVLNRELRDEIYRRVVDEGQTVREVSVALHVSMERVGAVVRLKTIELDWRRKHKLKYNSYERTVMSMLPQTEWSKDNRSNPRHESINDLPVHSSTLPQIFWPTSESRHFTRVDAGKVFHDKLLPADQRLPHPEMIEEARDALEGYRKSQIASRLKQRFDDMEAERKEEQRVKQAKEDRHTFVVQSGKWDFRFKDVQVEAAGKDGRSRHAFAARYGAPPEDRKPGQVKIPTKVE